MRSLVFGRCLIAGHRLVLVAQTWSLIEDFGAGSRIAGRQDSPQEWVADAVSVGRYSKAVLQGRLVSEVSKMIRCYAPR